MNEVNWGEGSGTIALAAAEGKGHRHNHIMRKVRNQTQKALTRAKELRREMSQSEKKLWALLRNRRHEFKFRKQHAIDIYFLDFYCAEAKLCIEVDGEQHAERQMQDAIRDGTLQGLGIATLRIPSLDLYSHPDAVVEKIWQACKDRTSR